jgi:hypothetical protein
LIRLSKAALRVEEGSNVIAYRASISSLTTAAALCFVACSGSGSGPTSPSVAAPQGAADVPRSVGAQSFEAPSDVLLPTFVPAALHGGITPNLTKPIIDDSGSFAGGPIIIGTNTAKGTGVEGYASASGGNGIVGMAPSSNSGGVAVFGEANGVAGNGVYGFSAQGIGVRGYSGNSTSFAGYFSNAPGTAVDAVTTSGSGVQASATSGTSMHGSSQSGFGIIGERGTATQTLFPGFAAMAPEDLTSGGSFALNAISQSGTAVAATTDNTSSQPGVVINSFGTNPMIEASDSNGAVMSLDGSGNFAILGSISAASATITTPGNPLFVHGSGHTRIGTYAQEAAAPSLEDVGQSQLHNGSAYVALDPKFAALTDPRHPYLVFFTPGGDCRGLYFSQKTSRGFYVREIGGGVSNVAFDYRIVARPNDATGQRLPAVSAPKMPLSAHAVSVRRL